MNINRKWASGIGADGQPVYAPKDAIAVGGRTVIGPKDKHYEAAGYKRVSEAAPSEPAPEGHHYEARGYSEDESRIWRVYEAVANPPAPPRRWSRLSIKTALAQADLLGEAKGFLTNIEIAPRYPAWEALSDCDYIEEGFGGAEAWNALLEGAATTLGKTRAEIDAFLDAIPREA